MGLMSLRHIANYEVSLVNTLELEKQLKEFDEMNDKYPMYKWACMYMKQVSNLLQCIRASQDCNWLLHLAFLEKMCVYFFAYNRHDYAQNIPDHIEHMYHLETSHSHICYDLQSGEFVVKTNPIAFTSRSSPGASEQST